MYNYIFTDMLSKAYSMYAVHILMYSYSLMYTAIPYIFVNLCCIAVSNYMYSVYVQALLSICMSAFFYMLSKAYSMYVVHILMYSYTAPMYKCILSYLKYLYNCAVEVYSNMCITYILGHGQS
jgi:hypothetical protein